MTAPKTLPADAHMGVVRLAFNDPRVHLLLLVEAGVLYGTLERSDVAACAQADTAPALPLAHLDGRTAEPGEHILLAHRRLVATGRRRLAVVNADGRLFGLLCLRRDGRGFCTDAGVASREAEHTALSAAYAQRIREQVQLTASLVSPLADEVSCVKPRLVDLGEA